MQDKFLDSRGNPTVEADVYTEDGIMGRAWFLQVLQLVNMKLLNLGI